MTLIAVIAVVFVLYAAREVLIPIALAVLLTFLLAPPVIRLQRWGLGRIVSVLIVTALSFMVLGLLAWIVSGQVIDLAAITGPSPRHPTPGIAPARTPQEVRHVLANRVRNAGNTVYRLTVLTEVLGDGFWSITVYGGDGYIAP